jgi:hypothetical protein
LPQDPEALIGLRANLYRFDLGLAEEDGTWRVHCNRPRGPRPAARSSATAARSAATVLKNVAKDCEVGNCQACGW